MQTPGGGGILGQSIMPILISDPKTEIAEDRPGVDQTLNSPHSTSLTSTRPLLDSNSPTRLKIGNLSLSWQEDKPCLIFLA